MLDQFNIAVACAWKCLPDEDPQNDKKAWICSTISSHSSHSFTYSKALHAYLFTLASYSSKVLKIWDAVPSSNASYGPTD